MIRVAIADDHPELRLALRLLLQLSKEIKVVCENGQGQEAVDCVKQLQPDVLVMDIQMPVLNGFEATRQIVELSIPTRVILISIDREHIFAQQAAACGAKGFVSKDNIPRFLLPAIEAVYRGEQFFRNYKVPNNY
jgi:DNA-binding NarL/FixJ family response regulator